MQRGRLGLAAVVLATAIFAMFPAAADEGNICPPNPLNPSQSVAGHGFIYCGQHWASFPRTYSVGPGVILPAAQAAAETWNRAWRIVIGNPNAQAILQWSSSSSNQITKAPLGVNGPVAQATVTPATGSTITDVDIALNSDLTWTANVIPPAQGEVTGVLGTPICKALPQQVCGAYDQQNAITHEFGHFLGLGDLGNPACFPSDLTAPVDVDQTMYACIAPGESMKRTLSWGDILGLRQVKVAMGL